VVIYCYSTQIQQIIPYILNTFLNFQLLGFILVDLLGFAAIDGSGFRRNRLTQHQGVKKCHLEEECQNANCLAGLVEIDEFVSGQYKNGFHFSRNEYAYCLLSMYELHIY